MGYRSQVYIKLTNERMPQLYSILLEHDLVNSCDFAQDSEYSYVHLSDVKWYDAYSDVTDVNNYIESLPAGQAAAIREGEDSTDIEYYNDCDEIGLYANVVVELEGFHFDNFNMQDFMATNHPEVLL